MLRVKLTDPDNFWVVGAGGDCVPLYYWTSDRGRTWQGPNDTLGTWHRLPGDGFRSLHGPSPVQEEQANPCSRRAPLVELDGVNKLDGAVLCADGSVHLSSDSGLTWAQAGAAVEGAIALSFVSGTTGFLAVAGDDDCAGLAVLRTDDAGDSWRLAGCASGARRSGPGRSRVRHRPGRHAGGGRHDIRHHGRRPDLDPDGRLRRRRPVGRTSLRRRGPA